MFDNNSKNPNSNNNKATPPKRFQPRMLIVYLLILGAIAALWNSQPNIGQSQQYLTVSEVIEKVEAGEITAWEGVIKPNVSFGREGYTIEGTFRSEGSSNDLLPSEEG